MKEENMEEDTEDEEAMAGCGATGTWVGPAVDSELVRMGFLFFFFFFPDLGDFKILLILLIINVNGELFFFFF